MKPYTAPLSNVNRPLKPQQMDAESVAALTFDNGLRAGLGYADAMRQAFAAAGVTNLEHQVQELQDENTDLRNQLADARGAIDDARTAVGPRDTAAFAV